MVASGLIRCIFMYVFILKLSCQGFTFPKQPDQSVCDRTGQMCKLAQNCPGVFQQVRAGNFPTICRFESDKVYVCCKHTTAATSFPTCGRTRQIKSNRRSRAARSPHRQRAARSPRGQSALDVLIQQANAAANRPFGFPSPSPGIDRPHVVRGEEASFEHEDFPGFPFVPPVVRGDETVENAYPWMAVLGERLPNGDMTWFCGGSLITSRLVLTAAHCLKEGDPSVPYRLDTVRLGAHDLGDNPDNEEYPDDYGIARVHVHPQYNANFSYNDIALIELDAPGDGVRLRDSVGLVCLPLDIAGASFPRVGSPVIVAGWGATSYGGASADKLQEATIQVIGQEECHTNYTTIHFFNLPRGITNNILCAGEPGALPVLKDACQGDSGGPLISSLDDGGFEVVGVVSGGHGCGSPGFPGLYTRVSAYVGWINPIIVKTHPEYLPTTL